MTIVDWKRLRFEFWIKEGRTTHTQHDHGRSPTESQSSRGASRERPADPALQNWSFARSFVLNHGADLRIVEPHVQRRGRNNDVGPRIDSGVWLVVLSISSGEPLSGIRSPRSRSNVGAGLASRSSRRLARVRSRSSGNWQATHGLSPGGWASAVGLTFRITEVKEETICDVQFVSKHEQAPSRACRRSILVSMDRASDGRASRSVSLLTARNRPAVGSARSASRYSGASVDEIFGCWSDRCDRRRRQPGKR